MTSNRHPSAKLARLGAHRRNAMGEAFNQRDKQNVIGQEGLNHSYSLAAGIIRDASDERHDEERNINGSHNGASRVL